MASTAVADDQTAAGARRWAATVERAVEAERHQIVLWAPVALGVGIALWFGLPHAAERWAALGGLILAAVAAWAAGGRIGQALAAGALLAAAGMGAAQWRSDRVAAPRLEAPLRSVTFEARVIAVEAQPARERTRLLLTPERDDLPPKLRVGLRGGVPAGIEPGALVRLTASLAPPAGPAVPGGYDFARRAWFHGVGGVGYTLGPPEVLRPAPPPEGAPARLADARKRLTAWLQTGVGGGAGGIAAALVTGDQNGIPLDVVEAMRDSGLAHLLSISGLHIAIVVGGVLWLVRRLLSLVPWLALRVSTKAAALVAAAAGIGYTLLAGAEVPAVRACIAAVIVLAGLLLGREAVSLRLVAAAAFAILVVRPEALLGPSFQLSFGAVTGLVALYQSRLGRRLFERVPTEGWLLRLARNLLVLVVTGLVAEAMLAPTALYHFQKAGLYGVLANLVGIPLTSFVIMPLLGLTMLAGLVGLGAPAMTLLGVATGWLISLAEAVAGLPGAVARMPAMPDAAYLLMAAGGLWLCLWQTRLRLAGVVPVVLGAIMAVAVPPADLLVSGDGRHVAIRGEGDTLLMLRDRAGGFVTDMWGDAVAADAVLPLAGSSAARCSADACVAAIVADGRAWRLLATRSRERVERTDMAAACAAADIVVSDRQLPPWCRARWLTLDAATLARTGALAIRLGAPPVVDSVAGRVGDHPWGTAAPRPRG